MCRSGSGLTDMLLFPLLDINTAKAVHNLANSILFAFLQVPSITAQRCDGKNLALCSPDFTPSFNFLTAGLRNAGQVISPPSPDRLACMQTVCQFLAPTTNPIIHLVTDGRQLVRRQHRDYTGQSWL